MRDRVSRVCWLSIVISAITLPGIVGWADIILPGYKTVSHLLVFKDSPALQSHRLVAMPVAGFGGMTEVEPEQPFSFSEKYGTRFYVVPDDYEPPTEIRRGEHLPFPSADVPVTEVHSVPVGNPVSSVRTTCELVTVGEDGLEIRVVDHQEFARSVSMPGLANSGLGSPISWQRIFVSLVAISLLGFIGCFSLWWRTRRATLNETNESLASERRA